MNNHSPQEETLLEKIRSLPPDKLGQLEDFIDFLAQRSQERRLTQAATALSEPAFEKVWDNPEDADYDRL